MRSGSAPSTTMKFFISTVSFRELVSATEAPIWSAAFLLIGACCCPYFGIKPHRISYKKNIIKECEEEAGIPASISTNVIPVGAVSYMDIEGYRYKRDVLFCYDLKFPPDFVPKNEEQIKKNE